MSHSLDVCLGEHDTQRYSLDGTKLLVKATQDKIDDKVNNQGIGFDTIFPPGITTEYIDMAQLKTILCNTDWMTPLNEV
jgi:hypothetical protein